MHATSKSTLEQCLGSLFLFEKSDIRESLGNKFEVSGIPTLLLLDESGVYNHDGRMSVMTNPQGFPWK